MKLSDAFEGENSSLRQAYDGATAETPPSFYRTIMDSPQWQAWVKHNEETPQYDVHESMELGLMSQNHWQAFIKWVKEN